MKIIVQENVVRKIVNKRTKIKSSNSEKETNSGIRLNKYIADSGYCSRRQADEIIKSGRVKVNNVLETNLSRRIQPGDEVQIDSNFIKQSVKLEYILLNKPKDTITTLNDEKNRKTVIDLVKTKFRLFPVGRLDRNTTGVLILTNDGELANRLMHPKYQVERLYLAGLDKPLKFSDAEKISKGVSTENFKSSPCEIFVDPADHTNVYITLKEGKNREVKKIFETLGYKVKKLDRKSFAGITTSGLARGEFRRLTKQEVIQLKKAVKLI